MTPLVIQSSVATESGSGGSLYKAKAIRNLERELEDIGFDRRQLDLDRREANVKAELQDARDSEMQDVLDTSGSDSE